jgi:vacuolar-type H+-ATPase subunit I/STV1
MKRLQELLERFKELLQEENRLLIQSVKDKEASQKILELVNQKEQLLGEIVGYNKEDLEKFRDLLEEIDELSQRNRALAVNNLEFINEIFDAIFSVNAPTQYTKDGNLSSKKEGLFNKKA